MTPIMEQQRLAEALDKLRLIYHYHPSLQDLEHNVAVMQSLSLSDDQIGEVITRGDTIAFNTITNPLNGEQLVIFAEHVSVRLDGNTGKYGVYIGNRPYKEFFAQHLLTRSRLDELSKTFPDISDIYHENLQLKASLAMLGKNRDHK